jgi:preprotein translocase subunit YajC
LSVLIVFDNKKITFATNYIMTFLNILLAGQSPIASFLPIILIIGVFYFFMIRPQMKKQKDEKKFRESLQKGDSIVTIGGLHAKVVDVEPSTVIVEPASGIRLKFEKSAISMNTTASNALAEKK